MVVSPSRFRSPSPSLQSSRHPPPRHRKPLAVFPKTKVLRPRIGWQPYRRDACRPTRDLRDMADAMDMSDCDGAMATLNRVLKSPPSSLTELSPRLPLISPLQLHPDSEPRPVSTISFLRLPAELRLLVYAELLVSDERLIPSWRGPRKASKRQKALHINILLTCKTCAIEGAEVLYGRNLFDFGEICNRPSSFSAPFVARIGTHNASLIRLVIAEYTAAAEELTARSLGQKQDRINRHLTSRAPQILLTGSYLTSFFGSFNIALPKLLVLAISIVPFGDDQATTELVRVHEPRALRATGRRARLVEGYNRMFFAKAMPAVVKRVPELEAVDFWTHIEPWLGFEWMLPWAGRQWVAYKGVREGKGVKAK